MTPRWNAKPMMVSTTGLVARNTGVWAGSDWMRSASASTLPGVAMMDSMAKRDAAT